MEDKIHALVLKSVDYKDNDKLVTLFTANGKIIALLKGCKKASAKLRFAAEPFCFAEYILWQKGNVYTCINSTLIDLFYNLREDAKKFYPSSAILEAVSISAMENEDSSDLFLLTVECLKNICYKDNSENTTLIYFLLNFFQITGFGLDLTNDTSNKLYEKMSIIFHSKKQKDKNIKISTSDIKGILNLLNTHFFDCFGKKLKSFDYI